MSNVNLTIGGRTYTVACAAGEEDHVAQLGRFIDDKVSAIQGQSEARTLLFGALLLADELHEAQQGGTPAPSGAAAPPADEGAEALEQIADRLEDLAARLEGSSWNA